MNDKLTITARGTFRVAILCYLLVSGIMANISLVWGMF